MTRIMVLALCTAALFAGCTDDQPAAPDDAGALEPDATNEVVAENLTAPVLVAVRDIAVGGIQEGDVLCTSGGTDFYDLPEEAPVPAAATRLRFEVTSGPTTTGVQAGYETADGITWFDNVSLATESFTLAITDDVDLDDLDFKYQLNTPAQQDCYTGASLGGYSIHVWAEA